MEIKTNALTGTTPFRPALASERLSFTFASLFLTLELFALALWGLGRVHVPDLFEVGSQGARSLAGQISGGNFLLSLFHGPIGLYLTIGLSIQAALNLVVAVKIARRLDKSKLSWEAAHQFHLNTLIFALLAFAWRPLLAYLTTMAH